jgi:hypothetical protein
MSTNNPEAEYLGDDVYAEVAYGRVVKLTTNDGDSDGPQNEIYIDGSVWLSLVSFVKRHPEELGFRIMP